MAATQPAHVNQMVPTQAQPAAPPGTVEITLIGLKSSGRVAYVECKAEFVSMLASALFEVSGEQVARLHQASLGGTIRNAYPQLLELYNRVGPLGYFVCSRDGQCRSTSLTMIKGWRCPSCSRPMDVPVTMYGGMPDFTTAAAQGKHVYVGEDPHASLLLTNDLEVLPLSTESAMRAAQRFHSKIKMSKLASLHIRVTHDEVLQLIRMAHSTDCVLETVFSPRFRRQVPAGSVINSLARMKTKKPPRTGPVGPKVAAVPAAQQPHAVR